MLYIILSKIIYNHITILSKSRGEIMIHINQYGMLTILDEEYEHDIPEEINIFPVED